MNHSQFEAKTFGLGELIAQRKLFRVPRHQRSYAWTTDAIESFLDDIGRAFFTDASQYFVGLIVIQGPDNGEWTLLDGQQRLTTTTMIYAAIRDWLREHDFVEDSRQIETEYLGVRRLGGEYSSRMLLNEENEECFARLVIDTSPNKRSQLKFPRKSSNKLLVDSYFACQKWVAGILEDEQEMIGKAKRLFRLSGFLESRVKAVCVEVSSEVDAYILFEALNDRGVELSALDLVKNHIFSKVPKHSAAVSDNLWADLLENLEGSNPDDFLKVFWTSRFGIIQKDQLFRKIREAYAGEHDVQTLLRDLADDSRILAAFEEPEHPLWTTYPPEVRDHIFTLNSISAKQTRPVLLGAFHKLSKHEFAQLLPDIISAVVRFQIIGRQRTGVVERVLGRICMGLGSGSINSLSRMRAALKELYLDDDNFEADFTGHRETKSVRIAYFLAAIERHVTNRQEPIQQMMARVQIAPIFNAVEESPVTNEGEGEGEGEGESTYQLLGNFALFDREHTQAPGLALDKTAYVTTRETAKYLGADPREAAATRSAHLARIAKEIWRIDFSGGQNG